ncbi:hypothetical protein [Vibrio owensii]|uniref:hypothetical protein n=1 Tax=Vibrio owensii TaxID=696485 RepID=UPI0018F15BC6|nr:hypothetical protein [Vibrio owensii]
MKNLCINLGAVLGLGLLMLLVGAAVCFGMGWIVNLVALDYMIATGLVKSSSEYWGLVKTLYIVILLPPIYINLFRMLPYSTQESIKDSAKATGLAVVHIGDWLGKGVLLAVGFYFVAQHFNF